MKILSRILCVHLIYLITSALISNNGGGYNNNDYGFNENDYLLVIIKNSTTTTSTTTTTTTTSNDATSFYLTIRQLLSRVASSLTLIRGAEARCIMREPMSSEAREREDPYGKTWYNGKYDGEPQPLSEQRYMDEFKKICAPMYVASGSNDRMPLCCSNHQIPILKHSLVIAEQLLGACAPCFLNFRLIWCHMTCSPNQTDFLIPIEHEIKPLQNFTRYEQLYAQHISNSQKKAKSQHNNQRSSKY